MIGFFLLMLILAVALGYFLYKNRQDKRKLMQLLRDTKAEDEEHDKTSVT